MAEVKRKRRRKAIAIDYADLITKEQEALTKLESDKANIIAKIKEKKATIKKLEKEKAIYDAQKAEEEKARQMREVAEMITASGKSFDEIKEFLSK